MDEIYRFRSCGRLLGSDGELATRTIYFAEPSKLNDPMEGIRELVWQGDAIAWVNLFRHYLCCLNFMYSTIRLGFPAAPAGIPVNQAGYLMAGEKYAAMIDRIWESVAGELQLEQLASRLERLGRRVRSHELEFYLGSIHEHAFEAMDREHTKSKMRDPAKPLSEPMPLLSPHLAGFSDSLMHGLDDPDELEGELVKLHQHLERERLQAKASRPVFRGDVDPSDQCYVVLDFPREYIARLISATSPPWYAACFSETYADPTQWSHYADGHQGACLVFAPGGGTDGAFLDLSPHIATPAELSPPQLRRVHFQPVRYVETLDDVDFFERIALMSEESLMAVWFTDREGRISTAATHLSPGADIDAWRAETWSELRRDIRTKTRQWKREREHRLIHVDVTGSATSDPQLTWQFELSALKAIIFGIRTTDAHKLEIIDTIAAQCRQAGRDAFDFRQAYRCANANEVRSFPIDIDITAHGHAAQPPGVSPGRSPTRARRIA